MQLRRNYTLHVPLSALAWSSPLSAHSIRNLEAELRTKLFHRTTRRTWLMRAGLRFFTDARRILGEVDAAAISLRVEGEDSPERVSLALAEDLGLVDKGYPQLY